MIQVLFFFPQNDTFYNTLLIFQTGMDESALDSLIDTLGGLEEDEPTSPVYTGPEVTVLSFLILFFRRLISQICL